jgi:hypothetical protein
VQTNIHTTGTKHFKHSWSSFHCNLQCNPISRATWNSWCLTNLNQEGGSWKGIYKRQPHFLVDRSAVSKSIHHLGFTELLLRMAVTIIRILDTAAYHWITLIPIDSMAARFQAVVAPSAVTIVVGSFYRSTRLN